MVFKILAGIGLVIILVAAGWAGAKVVQIIPNVLSGAATALNDIRVSFSSDNEPDEEDMIGPEENVDEPDPTTQPQEPTPATTPGPRETEIIVITPGPVTPTSNPLGTPDLVVTFLSIGIVDDAGNFTPKDQLASSDNGALKFEISNAGDKETGPWKFTSTLPTRNGYVFKSKTQRSLFPGEKIEYILGFDRISKESEASFGISVDPDNLIAESDETNNIVKIELLTF